ncbi:MAG: type I-B CRISPR-associated protein Cas5b [Peptoniphilaceae bacterium]
MKILEFKLSGKTAFFKNPEVNAYKFYTYSSISRVHILGILGSIAGLRGYNQQDKSKYPEWYEKLKDLKVSIEIEKPLEIKKTFQRFNNSVGYASNEQGNILVVDEQWLEDPSWIVRIMEDSTEISKKIINYILNDKCVYIPYLGKNDHFASISEVREIQGEEFIYKNREIKISGLFKDKFDIYPSDYNFYKYSEELPVDLNEENHYILEKLNQSNGELELKKSSEIGKDCLIKTNENILYFIGG